MLYTSRTSEKGAMFDARLFQYSERRSSKSFVLEAIGCFSAVQFRVWLDKRTFPHKELQRKTCSDIQDMLMTQKGINWNELPTHQKRGSCCIKTLESVSDSEENKNGNKRPHWIIDTEIPIFRGEGREYIDKLVYVGEE